MKAKTAKPSSTYNATRCRHRTANGRCRMPAVDSATNLCFDHARKALQARQDSDFARYLTRDSAGFQTAQGINHSLADLYTLLAHGHISPRRGSVLAYVASLLLRSLPAIDKDPSPDSSRPINLLDATMTHVSPSNPSSASKDEVDEAPDLAPSSCSGGSLDPSPEHDPSSVRRSPSETRPAVGPATKPLPATAEEFAAQILDRKPN
jgi:hypothetical protein